MEKELNVSAEFDKIREIIHEHATSADELHEHLIHVLNYYTTSADYTQRQNRHREDIAHMHTALMRISSALLVNQLK